MVKGEPKTEHPYKVRYDYSVNPCQPINVPDAEAKVHCLPGAWVCRDKKVFFDETEPKTVSLQPIAGTAPAAENVPAREVAPLVALADKMENVAEGMFIVFVVVSDGEDGRGWGGNYSP